MTNRVIAWGLAAGLLLPGWAWTSRPADVNRADVRSPRVRTAHPRHAQPQQTCRTDYAGFLADTVITCLPAIGSQAYPDVVLGDSGYFVVWEQWHRGNVDIYGARLRSDGVLLDSGGIAICCAEEWQLGPAIAFDGLNFLVVWEDERNGQT